MRPARSMVVVTSSRNREKRGRSPDVDLSQHWKDALGPAPPQGDDAVSFVYQFRWL